jgi:hypothetical protein
MASMDATPTKLYTLKMRTEPTKVEEQQGNFKVEKVYEVDKYRWKNAPAVVVQAVSKRTRVRDADGKVYSSTKDIADYTDGNVLYSNDEYFEIFVLKRNGTSQSADAFGNNSLTGYHTFPDGSIDDEPETYKTGDPEYATYKTEGSISVDSWSWVVLLDPGQSPDRLYGFGWSNSEETPAYGLPFLDAPNAESFRTMMDRMIQQRCNSNIVEHNVKVTWDNHNPMSKVSTTDTASYADADRAAAKTTSQGTVARSGSRVSGRHAPSRGHSPSETQSPLGSHSPSGSHSMSKSRSPPKGHAEATPSAQTKSHSAERSRSHSRGGKRIRARRVRTRRVRSRHIRTRRTRARR